MRCLWGRAWCSILCYLKKLSLELLRPHQPLHDRVRHWLLSISCSSGSTWPSPQLSSTLWLPVWHCGDGELTSEHFGFCCRKFFYCLLTSSCIFQEVFIKALCSLIHMWQLVKETNISPGEIDFGEYFYNPNALFLLIKCPATFPVIGF